MIDGRTVMELPNAKLAKSEIERIWAYLAKRMGIEASVAAATLFPEANRTEELQVAV